MEGLRNDGDTVFLGDGFITHESFQDAEAGQGTAPGELSFNQILTGQRLLATGLAHRLKYFCVLGETGKCLFKEADSEVHTDGPLGKALESVEASQPVDDALHLFPLSEKVRIRQQRLD